MHRWGWDLAPAKIEPIWNYFIFGKFTSLIRLGNDIKKRLPFLVMTFLFFIIDRFISIWFSKVMVKIQIDIFLRW